MSIDRFFTRQLVILTASTAEGRYGNTEPDWTDVTETEVLGWLAQQRTGDERPTASGQTSGWVVYLPAGTTITSANRIRDDRGVVYEVDGEPWPAHTPAGEHHIEANLRMVAG